LATVIEYCKKHVDAASFDELEKWNAEFVKIDQNTLLSLIMAANLLDIKTTSRTRQRRRFARFSKLRIITPSRKRRKFVAKKLGF